ncbi:MAG: SWIM zinc finger family protein [Xanthobacteraceae bacterium]|nr:SWIM zinc finger family protein [Xanthobacteraceae bacterium]
MRKYAGDKVFARGREYFNDGQVQILLVEPKRVVAQVAGTEDYRTFLTGRGKSIDGECSCPAFEDWGFCKHMVAVALTVNAMGRDAEAEGAGALARIREHLKRKGVDALVEMVMTLADRDPTLLRKLDVAAATGHGDDKAIEARLGKAIDRAVRTTRYVEYGEAGDWAAHVDEVLDTIAELASNGRAAVALKLVNRAMQGIEQAIGSIDDSDGDCSALLERAGEIHRDAVLEVRPEPVQLARELFARAMNDEYGVFGRVVSAYADALGETGLAEYRRLATEAWEKLPPRTGKGKSRDTTPELDYFGLMRILDYFAERDGDVDARIALRAKDLSSPWAYLQLAEFCLAQGRKEEALRRAEEGLWVFEDSGPDVRLVLFTAKLLIGVDRKQDAEAHLWRAFETAPSIELYERLRKLAPKSACERAVAFLEARTKRGERVYWFSRSDLLIEILIREKKFDAAWAAVHKHKASINVRLTLAGKTSATRPRDALAVYSERVEQLANGGGNTAYEEAAKLIGLMAPLQTETERKTYVATLKARHGRKRNFMKLMS